jgi:anti-sigma factor RsiW
MPCIEWRDEIDAYLDGELSEAEARLVAEHLRSCPACAAESVTRAQLKHAVRAAAERYRPEAAFRRRIEKQLASSDSFLLRRFWLPLLAGAAVLVAIGFLDLARHQQKTNSTLSEVADLYVATLASTNPVDVVSTDRHTVKPWFEGKVPFTFNLPELQNTTFVLVGGKVTYLNQSPGAELIFRLRQHQISVFIFQERTMGAMAADFAKTVNSFAVQSWNQHGLRYIVIGDVAEPDIDRLSGLLKAAE